MFEEIWQHVKPFTMTSVDRGRALFNALAHTHVNAIGGCVVECGTWKGGSMMLAALTLRWLGDDSRELFLFDTFSGMTTPGASDLDLRGRHASDLMAQQTHEGELTRAEATIEEVRANMDSTGYPSDLVHYVAGDVAETLPTTSTGPISLLRLDTDFYDSTRHELIHLFPRLADRGVLIIDDYGHWAGCKQAVDEYFAESARSNAVPTLARIDYTGRLAVKRGETHDYGNILDSIETTSPMNDTLNDDHTPEVRETDPAPRDLGSDEPAGVESVDDREFSAIVAAMGTPPAPGWRSLFDATCHLVRAGVPGNVVACESGAPQLLELVARTLSSLGETSRKLHLFAATTAPEQLPDDLELWGYPTDQINLAGTDADDGPTARTGTIGLFVTDADNATTIARQLRTFYPRVTQHGIVHMQAYAATGESRQAADDYFAEAATTSTEGRQPLIWTAGTGVGVAVRSATNRKVDVATRYDYWPDWYRGPNLLGLFPSVEAADPAESSETRLRSAVPHIWRVDSREKPARTGILSTEEAAVLHAAASTRSGRRGLEIGSHFGWSSAHLLAAGLRLDVIDPAFGDDDRYRCVDRSLANLATGPEASYMLWPGFSPGIVAAVAQTGDDPYGFVFIDGQHDRGGPEADARAVQPFVADDAIIAFHDLVFADVRTAVRWLSGQGWKVAVINTMQVMAILWREGPCPLPYQGDPIHGIEVPPECSDLVTQ